MNRPTTSLSGSLIRLMSLTGLLFFAVTTIQAQTNPPAATQEVAPIPTHAGPVVMPTPSTTNTSADIAAPITTNAPSAVSPVPNAPKPTPAPAATTTTQVTTPSSAANATVSPDEIYDIRPPFFFLRSWLWLWITLAALTTIALLILVWYWLMPHHQLSAKTAYELTLEKLEKARLLLREDDPMPYAVFVSEIIRTYLSQRFQAPSTRRTTEEFLRLMETDSATPLAGHRDLLRNFLQSCDLVKFARYQPTITELEEVQQRAFNFVTATKPVPIQQNGRHA